MINIILADDQLLYRQTLSPALLEFDIHVCAEINNGGDLIRLIESGRKADLILLDLDMPVMNGSEALDILMANHPGNKIIIVTQYSELELVKDLFNRGIRAYVSKHEALDVMVNAIRAVHTKGYFKDNLPELSRAKTTSAQSITKYSLRPAKRRSSAFFAGEKV